MVTVVKTRMALLLDSALREMDCAAYGLSSLSLGVGFFCVMRERRRHGELGTLTSSRAVAAWRSNPAKASTCCFSWPITRSMTLLTSCGLL